AFDLQHLAQFERLQTRMRQIKRNRDQRLPRRREPLVAEIARRLELEPARLQLGVELRDPRLELRAFDAHAEIADAQREQLLVAIRGPGRLHHPAVARAISSSSSFWP